MSTDTSLLTRPRRKSDFAGKPLGWWGLVLFIATEGTLFASLLSSYFYIRSGAVHGWPPDGIKIPELTYVLPATVALLGSTVPAIVAEQAMKRGRRGWVQIALAATMLLGAIFLALEGWEFAHSEFGPQRDAYGSLFFTIISFHAMHLIVGLLILAYLQARLLAGHFTDEAHEALSNGTLYWHFVDVVWIAVFTTIYLSPRFG